MPSQVNAPDQLTPFERAVLAAALSIPFGETRTYAWVAARIGRPKAVRAVGQALRKNPWPLIIPCHRVVRSDGTPGAYAGRDDGRKQELIGLEARLRTELGVNPPSGPASIAGRGKDDPRTACAAGSLHRIRAPRANSSAHPAVVV